LGISLDNLFDDYKRQGVAEADLLRTPFVLRADSTDDGQGRARYDDGEFHCAYSDITGISGHLITPCGSTDIRIRQGLQMR
jgi:hypothetical protein